MRASHRIFDCPLTLTASATSLKPNVIRETRSGSVTAAKPAAKAVEAPPLTTSTSKGSGYVSVRVGLRGSGH